MARDFPLKIKISVIDAFTAPLANVAKKTERIGRGMKNVGQGLTLGVSAPLAGLGLLAIKTAADFEKMRTSLLTVFQGNQGAADAAFAQIKKFAKETPYEMGEVLQSFIKLKAYGLDPSEAALSAYGNTASAMGKSLDQMIEAVADAATGEFERLKEFGIKAHKQGQITTFTFRGIKTKVKSDAASIEKYLQSIGRVQFAGGMERQAGTLYGKFSNLTDTLKSVAAQIGDTLIKTTNLGQNMDKLGAFVQRAADAFDGLSPMMKEVIVYTGIAAVALGPLLTGLGFAAIGLAALISPVGIVLLGIAAVAGAFIYAGVRLGSFKDAAVGAFVGLGDIIYRALTFPLVAFFKLLQGAIHLISKLPGLRGWKVLDDAKDWAGKTADNVANGFTDSKTVQGWMAPEVGNTPAAAAQMISSSKAFLPAQQTPAKSEVSLVFKGLPDGVRFNTKADRNTNLDITQGLAMGGL